MMKTLPPLLEVIGQGALSPSGNTVAALTNAADLPSPTWEPLLRLPQQSVPVRRIDPKQEALLAWQKEPRLRRASPLAWYLTEAATQALRSAPPLAPERLGLVCALGTGSILYSRKFFTQTQTQGRRFASPMLFPETVYNSPVSHLASLLNITRASYTLMGDETAWIEALRVAQVWLLRQTVEAVVLVAGEELDTLALDAFALAGWTRRGLIATEGAGAIVVRLATSTTTGPRLAINPLSRSFRNQPEQIAAWRFFQEQSQLPLVLPKNGVPSQAWKKFVTSTGAPELSPDLGMAFTASAAWSFLQALQYRKTHEAFTLLLPGSNTAVSSVSFL